jgi:hypothetical protein
MTTVLFHFFVGLWENHFIFLDECITVFNLFLLNLLSLLQDFDRIVLDEVVLGVARMFGEELVVMPHDEDETLVLSIWIRILVPNFPNTTAWDHTSDPSSKSAMCPNGILAVGCIPIRSVVILNLCKLFHL